MSTETDRSATAEQVARAYFDALAKRDPDAAASFWHPDGIDDFVPVRVLRGPDEVRAFFTEMFAAMPDIELRVERVTADERVAAVEWRSSGTFSGGPFEGVDPTDRRVELRGVDCVEVEDGKIVRNTAYSDGADFARQIGLLPPRDSAGEKALKTAFNGATKLRAALRNGLER